MLRRVPLAAATAVLAAGLLAGCGGSSDAEETTDAAMETAVEQPAEETTSAAEEPMEESGGDVETVAYPDGWPADLPVPACDLTDAATYGTDLAASGGLAALTYSCADGEAEGAALMEALAAQTTETNNLVTSGFYETDTWTIQVGYDASEIKYNVTRK